MKTCSKCKQEKPLDQFNRDRKSPDGLFYWCKACASEKRREFYVANREREMEYRRTWYEANRERVAETNRAYEAANPGKRSEAAALHKARYPGRIAARKAVSHAVAAGKIPPASDLPCSVCGAPADHWHHHKGYAREHRLDVVAVCRTCHFELHRVE